MSTSVRRSPRRSRKVVSYTHLLSPEDDISEQDSQSTPSTKKKMKLKYDDSYQDITIEPESEEEEMGANRKGKFNIETMTPGNELSDYEKTIMKNIEERNKFMVAMGFPEAIKDLTSCLPVKDSPKDKPKIKRPRPSAPKEILPLREPSRRLRNMAAANSQRIKAEVEEEIEKENMAAQEDDRLLDTMEMEAGLKVEVNCDVTYNPDLDLSTCDIDQYKDQLAAMKLLKCVKMNPGRIQCLHVHSSAPHPLVFSGDKYGHFCIWRPNQNKDGDEEQVILHKPHRAGLNCISTSVADKSVLYTTSFDGTIVQTDLNKGQFTNIFATDFNDRISHITWHDEVESRKFLIAHGRGDVGILDSVAGKTVQQWIDCFPRSVKTVQHHPTQSHYFIAASGTGNVKIFDLRNPAECIFEEKHPKSVSSAFFSPNGKFVLTNCSDDRIRVFDSSVLSPTMKKTASYLHNNFTGRWLTPFKAVWVPQRSDVFHIGSMLNNPRRIRFYCANSEGLLMDVIDEGLNTICSAISMHPAIPLLAGGNSSGKVHLFGPSDLIDQN